MKKSVLSFHLIQSYDENLPLICLSKSFGSLFVSFYFAEIQRGRDQGQVPVDSRGKPCDPQQGLHLEEVRQSRGQITTGVQSLVLKRDYWDWMCILDPGHHTQHKLYTSISSGACHTMFFLFRRFITYCVNEKGYTGFDFRDADGEDDIVSRLANLKFNVDSDSKYSWTNIYVGSFCFRCSAGEGIVVSSCYRSRTRECPAATRWPWMEKWALTSPSEHKN